MAPFAGFIGGSYQAGNADSERSLNFYPEKLGSPGAASKGGWRLLSKPGLNLFSALPTLPVQALFSLNDRAFAVAGGVFYELFSDGSRSVRGAVQLGPTMMCATQSQLLILSSGSGYIFNFATGAFALITAAGWPAGATQVAMLDGYFIALAPHSQVFAISALNDGLSWNPLDFGDAEGQAGNVVGMIADHRQLWLLSSDHSEVYYDSGNADFPFTRLEGAFLQAGCAVGATIARMDNTIFWLGSTESGSLIVYEANGYTPERVSTHAVEEAFRSYTALNSQVSDASAYCYQENGHTFYRIDFPSVPSAVSAIPSGGASWLYDRATGMWHERAYWDAQHGVYRGDLARTHTFCWNKHLVGDYRSGNIYEQSMSYFTDGGAYIRRERRCADISQGGRFSFYSEFRLLCDVGVGGTANPEPAAPATPATYVQAYQNSDTGVDHVAQTFPSPNTAGNAIIVVAASSANVTVQSPTDTQGNTYSLVKAFDSLPSTTGRVSIFVAYSIHGGANTVTAHFSSAASVVNLVMYEYANLPSVYSVLSAAGLIAPSGTLPVGSLANLANNTAFAMVFSNDEASTVGPQNPPTWLHPQLTDIFNCGIATRDATLTPAGTLTGTFVNSSPSNAHMWCAIVVFGTGAGAVVPTSEDPQIILQCSNDGGKTWGIERQTSLGRMGEYSTLVRWRRLGRSNNRVFRVICSEPVPIALIQADIDVTPGT